MMRRIFDKAILTNTAVVRLVETPSSSNCHNFIGQHLILVGATLSFRGNSPALDNSRVQGRVPLH